MRTRYLYIGLYRFLKRKVYRSLTSLCENVKSCLADEYVVCGSLSVGIVTFLSILVVWLLLRDPCQQTKITESLCQQYHEGAIAGSWCYDICVDRSIKLVHCLQQEPDVTTFFWNKAVIKVTGDLLEDDPKSESKAVSSKNMVLKEGLTVSAFKLLIQDYLNQKLGHVNHTTVCDQLIEFADFNQDGKLSLGEATSVWQLLQIHEFFLLFLFQGSYAFPILNGTCGSLYAMEYVDVHGLYQNQPTSLINKVFSNSYRWSLPHWTKRANIGIGLLEYSAAILEEADTRFFMCDFGPMNFGYTSNYELKVISVRNIMSESMLEYFMKSRNCLSDYECSYGNSCIAVCNRQTNRCTGEMKQPFLVGICELMKEYLLHDAPRRIRPELGLLLSKCVHLKDRGLDTESYMGDLVSHHIIKHNLILNELKLLLWKEIKDVQFL
ncbi:hypothetical protein ScPMuIL_009968 [Solemya velum]